LNFRNDLRKKLPDLPWGEPVVGTLVLMCDECETVWKMQVDETDNNILCMGIGERCAGCRNITLNWCLDLLPLSRMADWF